MTDEAITPDEVSGPGTAVAVADPEPTNGSAAIEAAADAAMTMPGVPGRDEFLALAMQARMLAMSGAAPEAVRNNPYVAFHVAMVGRDLGISPSAALQLIDVIKTRGGHQLSLSPQLLNGQIRRLGLGRIVPVVQERDRAVAQAVGPDGTVLGETEFTWADAQDAGLAGSECQPGHHKTSQRRRQDGSTYTACPCNQGYITYPRRMMWWRASGFCAADHFPEAGLGLYSPEELGSVVDDQGRPIDPAQVALPAGYDDPKEKQQAQQAAADRLASPEKLWELQGLIHALPDALRTELRTQWMHEECRVREYMPQRLPQRLLAVAKAMVNAKWAAARRVGVDQAAELLALQTRIGQAVTSLRWGSYGGETAATGPQDETSAPTPAPEPPQPATDDDSPQPGPVDWASMLREVAEEVRASMQGVPDDVAGRITRDVAQLHHSKVNAEIAAAELGDHFPPEAPIDLRRMVVTSLRLAEFAETGVIGEHDAE